MWFCKWEVRDSRIHGKGVFVRESVPRGRILSIGCRPTILREEEYLLRARTDPDLFRNSVRLLGKYYGYEPGGTVPEDYINHSANSNVLYHMGALIALRDIQPDEELTVDYNHYFGFDADGHMTDRDSGEIVHGSLPRQSLVTTCSTIISLVTGIGEWDGT